MVIFRKMKQSRKVEDLTATLAGIASFLTKLLPAMFYQLSLLPAQLGVFFK